MSTVITITAFMIITVTSAPQGVNLVLTVISVVCVLLWWLIARR
jgi:hypothetical protein